MGRVLVVGDSLTAGRPGVEFTSPLERTCGCRVLARGRGGETLAGLAARLPGLLDRHHPDAVVIEIGTNDVLLPWFITRGGAWRRLAERVAGRGSEPTPDPERFAARYAEVLDLAGRRARVVACTLTCLGEDPTSELNARRAQHSAAIVAAARAGSVTVADLGSAFDAALAAVATPSTYLLEDHTRLFRDAMTTASGADALSRRRGLTVTVDGVHLNRRGAALVVGSLGPALRSLVGPAEGEAARWGAVPAGE